MVKHKWDKASLSSMREATNRAKEQALFNNPVFAKAHARAKANAARTAEEQYWTARSAELDRKIAEIKIELRPEETRVYVRVGSSDPKRLRKPKRRRVRVRYHYEYFIQLWGKLLPTTLQEALQHGYKEEDLIAKKVIDKAPMLY